MTNPEPAPHVPTVTTTPRLGRGVRWSDMAREIELDELERQARRAESRPATEVHQDVVIAEALAPTPPSPSWLARAIHRRFG